jgi:seryl-tRNA synthetase
LLTIPQPPDDDCARSARTRPTTSSRARGASRAFSSSLRKATWSWARALGLINFEAGVELAGSRSYFLTGLGAEMHQAVLRMAFDLMTREKGFTAITVPVLVREVAMRGTGFFPAGKDQTYHVIPIPTTRCSLPAPPRWASLRIT